MRAGAAAARSMRSQRFGSTTDAIKAAGRGAAVAQGAEAGAGACAATPGLEELAPVCGAVGAKLAGIAYDQIVTGLESLFGGGDCTGPICTAPPPESVGGCGFADPPLVAVIVAANPWLLEEPPLLAQPGVLSWKPLCPPFNSTHVMYCPSGATPNPATITYGRWWDMPISGPAGTLGRAYLSLAKIACAEARAAKDAGAWEQGAAQAKAAADHGAWLAQFPNMVLTKAPSSSSSSSSSSAPMSTGAKVAIGAAAVTVIGVGGALAWRASQGLPLFNWRRWR